MAEAAAHGVGVRFAFDRQQRVTSPTLRVVRRGVVELWGLADVSFSIGAGSGVALLGASGAGKTTLLRVLAGVYTPDAGRVDVRGRIGALLSTEAGLMSALTGRENAVLLGVLAGLSRTSALGAADDLRESSGLGPAFDRPVSSYSEGMKARLAFTVVERTEPDVLLLDEVHEALDHEFRARAEERARAVLARGGIVVAAGHDHELIARLCDRALLLDRGRVVADGPLSEVRREYYV